MWTRPSPPATRVRRSLGDPVPGLLDPATASSGAYTYEVVDANAGCSDQAVVTVSINAQLQAGTSTSATLCSDAPATDLFALLGPSADPGGSWSGPGPLTGSLFDPLTGTAGVYTYTLTATPPCIDAQSTVTVVVNVAPDAGSGGALSVCNTSPAIDLFLQLGGTPDAGGTWTDPNGLAHGTLFDPAVDPAGTYSYTVAGTAPCAADLATISITVDPQPDAGIGRRGHPPKPGLGSANRKAIETKHVESAFARSSSDQEDTGKYSRRFAGLELKTLRSCAGMETGIPLKSRRAPRANRSAQ